MKSAAAIAFDYRPSRRLCAAVAVVCALAIAAAFWSGFDLRVRLPAAASALAYAAWEMRRFLASAPRRAAWREAGHWRLACDDAEHLAELRGSTVRAGWIVLDLRRGDGRRITLVLSPDNCDADTRRRLRVRLARVSGEPASAATP